MEKETFEVTASHLALLERSYVSWDDCEFGAPAIDCKRPYGNSSVLLDLYEIIYGEQPPEDEDGWERVITDEQEFHLETVHKQMKTVLQILVDNATTGISLGWYTREKYGLSPWRLK